MWADGPTAGRTVSWAPISGVGNCAVSGKWTITPSGSGSLVQLENHVVLELKLPRLLRPLAQPTLERNNTVLIEGYLANLATTLDGADGRVALPELLEPLREIFVVRCVMIINLMGSTVHVFSLRFYNIQ